MIWHLSLLAKLSVLRVWAMHRRGGFAGNQGLPVHQSEGGTHASGDSDSPLTGDNDFGTLLDDINEIITEQQSFPSGNSAVGTPLDPADFPYGSSPGVSQNHTTGTSLNPNWVPYQYSPDVSGNLGFTLDQDLNHPGKRPRFQATQSGHSNIPSSWSSQSRFDTRHQTPGQVIPTMSQGHGSQHQGYFSNVTPSNPDLYHYQDRTPWPPVQNTTQSGNSNIPSSWSSQSQFDTGIHAANSSQSHPASRRKRPRGKESLNPNHTVMPLNTAGSPVNTSVATLLKSSVDVYFSPGVLIHSSVSMPTAGPSMLELLFTDTGKCLATENSEYRVCLTPLWSEISVNSTISTRVIQLTSHSTEANFASRYTSKGFTFLNEEQFPNLIVTIRPSHTPKLFVGAESSPLQSPGKGRMDLWFPPGDVFSPKKHANGLSLCGAVPLFTGPIVFLLLTDIKNKPHKGDIDIRAMFKNAPGSREGGKGGVDVFIPDGNTNLIYRAVTTSSRSLFSTSGYGVVFEGGEELIVKSPQGGEHEISLIPCGRIIPPKWNSETLKIIHATIARFVMRKHMLKT